MIENMSIENKLLKAIKFSFEFQDNRLKKIFKLFFRIIVNFYNLDKNCFEYLKTFELLNILLIDFHCYHSQQR